jgi:hypothetical protein
MAENRFKMRRENHHHRYGYLHYTDHPSSPSDSWTLGISHAYGGALSALSIHYTLTPAELPADHMPPGGRQQIWKEIEVVKAVYPSREEILVQNERHVEGDFSG